MTDLGKTLRQNIREYGMYIALFVIMAIFAVTTDGHLFVSARNISNLLNQTGYIAVLAVGMTLVIVIRHIDLSVGFWPASSAPVTGDRAGSSLEAAGL
jgi:putative multiple sugar transport system permease protein